MRPAATTADSGQVADSGVGAVDSGGVITDSGDTPPDSGAAADAATGFADAGSADAAMTNPDATAQVDAGPAPCVYPTGAPALPTDGEIIFPYRWAQALDAQRVSHELDLEDVYCASSTNIDWTAFPYVLFMAVPAW